MSAKHITRAHFRMDALGNEVFEGFTDGSDWNGWACPFFVKAVAEKVLKASEKNGYLHSYDKEKDAFIVTNTEDPEDYEPEIFEATKITIDNEEVVVYPIGAYYWIWETY